MRNGLKIITKIAIALTFVIGFAFAQTSPESPSVLNDEVRALQAVTINGVTHTPPSGGSLVDACYAYDMPYGFMDLDNDGLPDILRVYGADIVAANTWAQLGPRALAPMRERAVLKAQAQAARSIEVFVAVKSGLIDDFADDATGGDAILDNTVRTQIQSEAQSLLRGAVVNGHRLVSLENNAGVCIVVRYDIPVLGNIVPQGSTTPNRPNADQSSEPNTTQPSGYLLPPPGSSGTF